VNASDPVALSGTDIRPVSGGTTFLQSGAQRILTFKLPVGDLALDQAQVLVVVQSNEFDPQVELLGPDGLSVGFSGDSERNRPDRGATKSTDRRSLIYTSVSALPGAPDFFVVVSSFDPLGQGTFAVRININPREKVGDEYAVSADRIGDILELPVIDTPIDPTSVISTQFRFAQSADEFFFFMPQDGETTIAIRPLETNALDPTDPQVVLEQALPPVPIDSSNISLIQFGADGTAVDLTVRVHVEYTDKLVNGTSIKVPVTQLEPRTTDSAAFPLTRGEYILVLRVDQGDGTHSQTPRPSDQFELEVGPGLTFTNALGK
jgi:hypothetical protein